MRVSVCALHWDCPGTRVAKAWMGLLPPETQARLCVEKVAASIKAFGWRQPVVVDSEEVIVIGHLRRAAGKSIGEKECPVHVARDLSPAQIKALRLADNRTNEESTWHLELLPADFADLKGMYRYSHSVHKKSLH